MTYIFLALMSTAVSLVLAYGLIRHDEAITRHTRALLIMAIGMLLGAFTALATELGSLLNMVWILLSPNPSSPIWWMGTLYSIELVLIRVVNEAHSSVVGVLGWASIWMLAPFILALILVLGIAVAAALIKLGEQFLMDDQGQAAA